MTDKYIQLKDADDNNLFPTNDYNNSINIPSINGVPLIGNKSLDELGLLANGKKLLWSNPDPSVAFAAQTITLSEISTNYDLLMVFGQFGTATGMRGVGFLNPKETAAQVVIFHYSGYQCSHRQYTISGNSIAIGGGYVAYGSTNNADNTGGIPREIYGINFKGSSNGGRGSGIVNLWTNPSTAGISTATYTLADTADFYLIKSVYRSTGYTDTTGAHTYTVALDGTRVSAVIIGTDGRYVETRNYLISGTTFTVYQGYEHDADGSATALNEYCYPVAVYGVYLRPTTINQYTYTLPSVTNSNLADLIYPIGSIYASTSSANPGSIFGGTWEALTRDNYASKTWPSSPLTISSGGSDSTTLTITTNGSPVYLSFDGDINPSSSASTWGRAAIYRGTVASGTLISIHTFQSVSTSSFNETFSVTGIDNVPAGTYTYTFYVMSGNSAFVLNENGEGACTCNAFELGADPSLYKWRRIS